MWHFRSSTVLSLLILVLAPTAYGKNRLIDPVVTPFPNDAKTLALAQGEHLIDYAVSPTKPLIALLFRDASRQQRLRFWDLRAGTTSDGLALDKRYTLSWIVWHPVDPTLFFLATTNKKQNVILRADEKTGWAQTEILSSSSPLQRLVVGPRPFAVDYANQQPVLEYRLFFGVKRGTDFAIDSITESGKRRYQMLGPATPRPKNAKTIDPFPASLLPTPKGTVLPVTFHPAGNVMVWQDATNCLNYAQYHREWPQHQQTFLSTKQCEGEIWFTPNGMGVVHWIPGQTGFKLLQDNERPKQTLLTELSFVSLPIVSPDGQGVVGFLRRDGADVLVYRPIEMPLANVANAWMFAQDQTELDLFVKNGGLFRPLNRYDQLFGLYESELYQCGGYSSESPTRPYVVTADVFWETFAAAYEGIFIQAERTRSIPAFWEFATLAEAEARKDARLVKWAKVFRAMREVRGGSSADPIVDLEVKRILAARGTAPSAFTGRPFDFGNLKPRGHYPQTKNSADYYRAFRYFTQIASDLGARELTLMSANTNAAATKWITSYLPFIAAPRGELAWNPALVAKASYAREPLQTPSVFPLSWGIDNEILFNGVFHPHWPPSDVISGPEGPRLVPSALDIGTVLGSHYAESLLEQSGDFARYPNLQPRLKQLRAQFSTGPFRSDSLYDQWLAALAVQWADDASVPGNNAAKQLFLAKRLQTGLASWASLRHTTNLVNERGAPECGEGGFESVELQFPKGYVEPDPNTFGAIAGLFEGLANTVATSGMLLSPHAPRDTALTEGAIRRLKESAETIRHFQQMAHKEIRGEELTDKEYVEIFHVGRAAEHNFLVFKSLASPDQGVSVPKPIPKISDVFGDRELLMAAVGRPLEWDFIYPALGRRMIGKGPVYSFYEFKHPVPLNDEEWISMVDQRARPPWVSPFLTPSNLACPARFPF